MDVLSRAYAAPVSVLRTVAVPQAVAPAFARPVFVAPTVVPTMPLMYCPTVDVGIPTSRFELTASPEIVGRQRQSNWCWAACVQMLLNYHGVGVKQEDVVARMFGGLPDQPADGPQVVASLTGLARDAAGQPAVVTSGFVPVEDRALVSELSQQRPLVVGLKGGVPNASGHGYVLTGARYAIDPTGQPRILSVVLRDPWPDNPSRKEMDYAEFQSRCMFAVGASVQRV